MEYEERIIKKILVKKGETIFDDSVIEVEVKDDADGEFLSISSPSSDKGAVWVDPEEWPQLKEMIDGMMKALRL